MPGISERVLAERLRELTANGILERFVDGEPPVARYRLTPCGTDLVDQLGPSNLLGGTVELTWT